MATQVKPEIKVDPAASTPTNMADVDEFEEDHELRIPAPPAPDGDGEQAWLVKVPQYIWKAWNDIYKSVPEDGEQVEVGKMRVYNPRPGDPPDKQRIQIRLNPGMMEHVELPKLYDLNIRETGYSNHLVFSEKDLPGHSRSGGFGFRSRSHLSAARPAGLPSKNDKYGSNKTGYRSAIPKQTALAPLVYHVADAVPDEKDPSTDAYFVKSYQNAVKPKRATVFKSGVDRTMHPGAANLGSFNISSRPGTNKNRKPPPKEKAVRVSQPELLDLLYQCFRRYRYCSLKFLRAELHQPEAFIKETLETIATLIRSGDFAMNYVLKPEYAELGNIKDEEVKEETALVESADEAGVVEESEMEMGDDWDDEGDFEDVKMDGLG